MTTDTPTTYPDDVMRLAEEALDNLLCNCSASCGGYDGLRAASILDIARAIMQDRASRIRSCLIDKPEAGEAVAWEAHDETTDADNFATSIYEAGYDGLLVARCNQNGNHPWQAAAIIRGLSLNKTLPLQKLPAAFEVLDTENGTYLTRSEIAAQNSGFEYNGLYRRDSAEARASLSPLSAGDAGESRGPGIEWLEPTPDDDWKPIETAPKTGFFLAWSPGHPDLVMTFRAEIFHQARTPGTPRHLSANHFTLWMPIPLPRAKNG